MHGPWPVRPNGTRTQCHLATSTRTRRLAEMTRGSAVLSLVQADAHLGEGVVSLVRVMSRTVAGAYLVGMRSESESGGFRTWMSTLPGRMFAAVAVVILMAGTGASIAAALTLGGIVAVCGLVAYAIGSRRAD